MYGILKFEIWFSLLLVFFSLDLKTISFLFLSLLPSSEAWMTLAMFWEMLPGLRIALRHLPHKASGGCLPRCQDVHNVRKESPKHFKCLNMFELLLQLLQQLIWTFERFKRCDCSTSKPRPVQHVQTDERTMSTFAHGLRSA